MKTFLTPTKSKIATFFVIVFIIVVSTILLFIINERDIAYLILYPLGLPLGLFDFITNSAFTPKECLFLCFPTFPEMAFTLIFDIIIVYLIACGIVHIRQNRVLA